MKPCPFCGGDDLTVTWSWGTHGEFAFVACTDCGAHGPWDKSRKRTAEEQETQAVALWNYRFAPCELCGESPVDCECPGANTVAREQPVIDALLQDEADAALILERVAALLTTPPEKRRERAILRVAGQGCHRCGEHRARCNCADGPMTLVRWEDA